MNDLLDNPAVQAGVVPFVVALALGFALARTRFLALAGVSGVVVVFALTVGFAVEPFTSVRKLMVASFAAAVIALALEAARIGPRRSIVAALSAAAGAAALGAAWRVLVQMEAPAAWAAGAAAFAFAALLAGSSIAADAGSSLRGAVTGALLGWGSGVLALLGASALLAQLGLAVGTACAALALVQMLRGQESPLGWTLVIPAAAAAGIVGVLASATGELRWYCLLPLLAVPLVARWLPVGAARPVWQRAFLIGFASLVPVIVAIALARWPIGGAAAA